MLSPKGLPVNRAKLVRGAAIASVSAALLWASFLVPPTAAAQESASGDRRVAHVVSRGETLSGIARRYGTTIAAVRALNGLSGDFIKAGQRLTVVTSRPVAASGTGTAAKESESSGRRVVHRVRWGETLSGIAVRYGTTIAAVRALNGLSSDFIKDGQRLTVVTTRSEAAIGTRTAAAQGSGSGGRRVIHRVRRGETLSGIAWRYGTTIAAVRALNGLSGDFIRAGQRLTVVATRSVAATRTRAARTLRELQQPRFKRDEHGALVPDIRAQAAIAYDPETGEVLWEQNAWDQRSIASITKLMTAAVFLENSPDLSQEVVVQRADVRRASTTYIWAGNRLMTGELLHLLLIGSDNAAARVLARVSPYGSQGFVDRMNAKARELGLLSTRYADPSGLMDENVSSAYDMARLVAYVSGNEQISEIMRKEEYRVRVGRRTIRVRSTNELVREGDVDVVGGKTGFIRRAGYCLAALLRLPQSGHQVAVVILGANSSAVRFWEARHLFNWLSSRAQGLMSMPLEAAEIRN